MIQMINTRLSSSATLTQGATIPVGSVVHKVGCNMGVNGNAITVEGFGHYKAIASVTVEPSAIADMTVTLLNNGNVVATASGTPAVANDPLNLVLVGTIYNKCDCIDSNLTITVNSAGTVTESDVIVERM